MRINRFALIYLALVGFAFISVREALHSKQFANFVSAKVTTWLAQGIGGEVKIGQIKIELFPLGMMLENVELLSAEANVELAQIKVNYGFQNAFKSDVFIDEVYLSEGLVSLEAQNDSKREKTNKEIIEMIRQSWSEAFDKIQSAPVQVQNLKLQNVKVVSEDFSVQVSQAHAYFDEDLHLKAQFEKIELPSNLMASNDLPEILFINISAGKKGLTLKDLKIQKGLASVSAQGDIHLEPMPTFDNLLVKIQGPDDSFTRWIPDFNKVDPNFEAYITGEIGLQGDVLAPSMDAAIELEKVSSKFIIVERAKLAFTYAGGFLQLKTAQLENDGGYLAASSNQKIDIKKFNEKTQINGIRVDIEQMPTKTLFHFLEGKLDPFVAKLSGSFIVDLNSKKLVLKSFKPLLLADFKLQLSDGLPLISHRAPLVKDLNLDLNFSPFSLGLNGSFVMPETELKLKAQIDDKGLAAEIIGEKFSFNDLKNIQGVELVGAGSMDIGILGPWESVKFNFNGDIKKSMVAGYQLGDIVFRGELPLDKNVLSFPLLKGKHGFTRYEGAISLDLVSKAYPLTIDFNANRATLTDLKEIVAPIIPVALSEQKDLQARFKTAGRVQVDFNDRPVKLDIDVDGESLSVAGEYFDGFGAKLRMSAGRLTIKELILKREGVTGRGQVIWDTDSDYLEYEFGMNGVSLTSFNSYRISPLSLEGVLEFDIYGSGLLGSDHSLRATVALQESTIRRKRVPNSKLDAYFSKGEWTFQGELMEGLGRLEAFVPVGDPNKSALVRLDLTAADIRPLVGLLAPMRMNEPSLNGRIFAQVQASFPMQSPELANVKLDIRDILIGYKEKNFRLTQNLPLIVKDGIFQGWNFVSSKDSDLSLSAQAKGNLGGNFSLMSNYQVPAQFFELLSDRLIDTNGTLDGRMNIDWREEGVKAFINHNARDVQFRLKDVPGRFSDLTFDAVYDDKEIIVQNISGKYGRGDFTARGKVIVNFPYPSVSLKFSVNDVTYPLFNRSEATFDSRFSLIGTKPPYLFSGAVFLQRVNLIDDVGTYLGEVSGGSSYERFIPNTTQSLLNQYLEINLAVTANNTIRVDNPLMEMILNAKLKLTGELMTPQIAGRVAGVPSKSKIAFKGHEFQLSKSTVDFSAETGPSKAILDLNGRTTVAGYNIDLVVNGALDQMNILLSSEPALPQDEIVSLLTLGITSDISRSLNDEDRRSITTMSLGGFLFDQLQLTRDLDDNLGLKVSLAPEFSSEDGNLVEEASSDTSSSRRLKTGTRLRVQSQLGKKTSVSFSSTLGGEVDQKQEMNINYDFNRAWSLEGVYEIKSSVEENQGDSQSLGADVKYRWSF